MTTKFNFVGPDQFCCLFACEEETKLRNLTNVMCLCDISCVVAIDRAEDYVLISVALSGCLVNRFKSHTWSTACWPKVNHNARIVFNNLSQLRLILNMGHSAHFGCFICRSLLRKGLLIASHVWLIKLVQHRLNVRVHLPRLLLLLLLLLVRVFHL